VRRVILLQIGIGTVGGAVLEQTIANRDRWRRVFATEFVIGALGGRDGVLAAEDASGLTDDAIRAVVDDRRSGTGLLAAASEHALVPAGEAIARFAAEGPTILLDAAAGHETAALGGRALASDAGLVLSNKAPLAMPFGNPISVELWSEATATGRLRYEATCGAGLPVISTLRTLLDTGDEVVEIQGTLSGTLGAIFSDIAAGRSFSAAVRAAKERGYTEPDPRDDLSGLDVARKTLILARTIGRRIDLDEIEIESLVPDHLRDVGVQEFLDRASDLDAMVAPRVQAAERRGATLKYVATVPADGPIRVGLTEVATGGVLGAIQGPENVIVIRSRRYDDYPLTIVGPGAGPAVTAAGMLGDALALAVGPLAGLGRSVA